MSVGMGTPQVVVGTVNPYRAANNSHIFLIHSVPIPHPVLCLRLSHRPVMSVCFEHTSSHSVHDDTILGFVLAVLMYGGFFAVDYSENSHGWELKWEGMGIMGKWEWE